MSCVNFKKATKLQAKLRFALIGPSGSGKTYSALEIARNMEGPVALIDTERGSASKYADVFDFDVMELTSFAPERYIEAIKAAEQAGYKTLIIDSLSHAWMGKGGLLEYVDKVAKANKKENNFTAWREATPKHNELIDAMLSANLHLIVTMRAKAEYVMEEYFDNNNRKRTKPVKVGMGAIQRDGIDFEFDIVGNLDPDNNMIIEKTRCSTLKGEVFNKPGKQVADILKAWLNTGKVFEETAGNTSSNASVNNIDAATVRLIESIEKMHNRIVHLNGTTPYTIDAVRTMDINAAKAASQLYSTELRNLLTALYTNLHQQYAAQSKSAFAMPDLHCLTLAKLDQAYSALVELVQGKKVVA